MTKHKLIKIKKNKTKPNNNNNNTTKVYFSTS